MPRIDPVGQMKTILVPADGSGASMEAVALGCNIAKRNKGRVYVVHVIEVRRSLPLDADLTPETERGEEILRQAEKIAREMDFEVEGELLQAREAGHAVVDEAVERKADLIIVGVEYDRSFGGFHLGTVSQYVLRNAPCHVWIWRHK
ncbi:MAG: universal stress protein [Dehalococcoidia bacterium]|nr:universal stress protein [Dehalococcoidia bacterium]